MRAEGLKLFTFNQKREFFFFYTLDFIYSKNVTEIGVVIISKLAIGLEKVVFAT